jgi:hypothetical protein
MLGRIITLVCMVLLSFGCSRTDAMKNSSGYLDKWYGRLRMGGHGQLWGDAVPPFKKAGGEAYEYLAKKMEVNDPEYFVHPAVYALVMLGKDSVPYLARALQHEQSEVRQRAIRGLLFMGRDAHCAVNELINRLKDASESVETRRLSIVALGNIVLDSEKPPGYPEDKDVVPRGELNMLVRAVAMATWTIATAVDENIDVLAGQAAETLRRVSKLNER